MGQFCPGKNKQKNKTPKYNPNRNPAQQQQPTKLKIFSDIKGNPKAPLHLLARHRHASDT